eukprot:733754-Pleurochrysis_carterae.AAC.1
MASTVAARLVGARALRMDEDLRIIDMRAQSRVALSPEECGGLSTAQRSAPRLASRITIDHTSF